MGIFPKKSKRKFRFPVWLKKPGLATGAALV
jgi:hypothetical protein